MYSMLTSSLWSNYHAILVNLDIKFHIGWICVWSTVGGKDRACLSPFCSILVYSFLWHAWRGDAEYIGRIGAPIWIASRTYMQSVVHSRSRHMWPKLSCVAREADVFQAAVFNGRYRYPSHIFKAVWYLLLFSYNCCMKQIAGVGILKGFFLGLNMISELLW